MGEFFRSLRFRLLCLVFLALTPSLILSLYSNWQFRHNEQHQWQQRCAEAMDFAGHQEKDMLQETRRMLAVLARTGPVRSANPRECRQLFELLLQHYRHFTSWGLAGTNGEVRCALPATPDRLNVADRAGFRQALRSEDFGAGGYEIGPISGTPGFSFAFPVLDDAGRIAGVLFTELNLNWFAEAALRLRDLLPEETSFTQVDQRSTVLAYYPFPQKWVGKHLPQELLSSLQPAGNDAISEAPDLDGRTAFHISGWMQSPVSGGRILYVLSTPKARLLAGANRSLMRNLIWLSLTAALALGVAWIGGDWLVVRPAKLLVTSVSRIEAGDLSVQTGPAGGMTELDQLARAFDRMVLTLKERDQQRQRVEETLRESEQKYRALFDNSAVGVFLTQDGVMVDCNEQVCRLMGCSRAEIIGHRPREFCPPTQPDGRKSLEAAIELAEAALTGTPQSFYWQGRRKDGTLVDTEATLRPLTVHGQSLLLATFHDISEVRRAERALRELSGRLLQLQDEERRHIARELHDNTAQWLAALAMNLTALESRDSGLDASGQKVLQDSQQLLAQCLSEVRTLSYLLHPPLLEELGLSGAIEEYAAGFAKRSGIQTHVQDLPDLSELPRDTGLALFRVLQECLANIHRHSGSAYAYIRLMQDENEVRLEVCDSGRGMEGRGPTDSPNGLMARKFGVGITGMRERLRQLGGSLEIDSNRQGTTVRARVPHRRAAS